MANTTYIKPSNHESPRHSDWEALLRCVRVFPFFVFPPRISITESRISIRPGTFRFLAALLILLVPTAVAIDMALGVPNGDERFVATTLMGTVFIAPCALIAVGIIVRVRRIVWDRHEGLLRVNYGAFPFTYQAVLHKDEIIPIVRQSGQWFLLALRSKLRGEVGSDLELVASRDYSALAPAIKHLAAFTENDVQDSTLKSTSLPCGTIVQRRTFPQLRYHGLARVARCSPEEIAIRRNWTYYFVVLLILVAAAVAVSLALVSGAHGYVSGPVICSPIAILSFLYAWRLVRKSPIPSVAILSSERVLNLSWRGENLRIPFEQILALQLCSGDAAAEATSHVFEINAITRAEHERIPILSSRNETAVRSCAGAISECMAAPLLDDS